MDGVSGNKSMSYSRWSYDSTLDDEGSTLRQQKLDRQRALLEQKQKKKRQEPLMVQSNLDGRSRTRRTRQSEEQAPLVESYLSSNSSTIYHVQEAEQEEVKAVAEVQAPRSVKKAKPPTSTPQTGSAKKEKKGKHKGIDGPAAFPDEGQIQILTVGHSPAPEGEAEGPGQGEGLSSSQTQSKQDLRVTMLKKGNPPYRSEKVMKNHEHL
ncbi:hypothetical protein AMEX_G19861 [Astyanax mexicanus]|uniref:Tubby N-terminal domain-containing protein n=1 Tax=Astyanax mexicanus TaxID=7994 RepID=A0A8T2LB19_ASTMX|nr:hypothetical protein AMEX_G19861 [Astyanax mexicanus]